MSMKNQSPPRKKFLKAEALSLVRSGEVDKGIEKYEQYLDLNDDDDDAWAGLGGAYRRKENFDKAIASYEKAYQRNDQSTYALVNLISLRAARNAPEDRARLDETLPTATKLIRAVIEEEKADFWAWYDLATLQLLQGEQEKALETFNYAAAQTPKTAKENFRSVLNNLNF